MPIVRPVRGPSSASRNSAIDAVWSDQPSPSWASKLSAPKIPRPARKNWTTTPTAISTARPWYTVVRPERIAAEPTGGTGRTRLLRSQQHATLLTTQRRGERREARGHPPHHRDHRRRAAERRVLRRHARPADGQEDRQPGRPDRLPPLLRRRARLSGRRPHLLRVSGGRPGAPRRRPGPPHRLARGRARGARLLGQAPRGPRRRLRARRRRPPL